MVRRGFVLGRLVWRWSRSLFRYFFTKILFYYICIYINRNLVLVVSQHSGQQNSTLLNRGLFTMYVSVQLHIVTLSAVYIGYHFYIKQTVCYHKLNNVILWRFSIPLAVKTVDILLWINYYMWTYNWSVSKHPYF